MAPAKKQVARGRVARKAPVGKASTAKLAVGDAPVRAYIKSLPADQRAIAQRFDDLMGRTFPDLERAIKWGLAFYANGNGWFVSCGGFPTCVKINFLNGTKLKPVPPVGASKYVRSLDVHTMAEFDDAQITSWVKQASRFPGMGAKKP